jgi:hypothetical protein
MTKSNDSKSLLPVSAIVVLITPERAKQLLSNTEGRLQRTPNPATIKEYSKQMTMGEWVLNYQPIQIGIDGNVLDGQHRLKACIDANISFETLLIDNVPEGVFDSIDRGRSRTLGDILSSRGIENSIIVAASISVLHVINSLSYSYVANDGSTKVAGSNRHLRLSPQQMNVFLKKNPDFISSVSDGLGMYRNGSKLLSPSLFISLWYYCQKCKKDKANTFFSKLSSGANVPENSPIFFIRKKLLSRKLKEDFIKSSDLINMILKGFIMYCNNELIKSHFNIPKEKVVLDIEMNWF